MTEVALGIDIGTGSTKAGLVDAGGRLLAVGRSAHAIVEPRPGWSESDPLSWLASARIAIAEALAGSPSESAPVRVVAIGFSGQMHGVVLCDDAMAPLRPAVLWSDRRSQPYLAELRARFSDDEMIRLANPVVAGMAGPTMAALVRDEPAVVARTATILQAKDWVRHRLTGEVATDRSDASATLLWDGSADRWWPEACQVFGVDRGRLPPVLGSAEPAGVVSAAGADDLGLTAGTPVATGAADTAAALLGAGLGSGEAQLSTGTGGQIARLTDSPAVDPAAGIHVFRTADGPAGPADRWYEMAAIQNAGIAIDWAMNLLGTDVADAGQAIEESPIGSNGVSFLPYLTGERTPYLDAGLCGGWTGLRPGTTRADLVRSVFEGVAFALRDGLDALSGGGRPDVPSGGDRRPHQLLLAGGGSAAGWWRRLVADVLDRPLVPHDAADASVRGAGLLAWASVGLTIDPSAKVQRLDSIVPSADGSHRYAEARLRFRAARPSVEAGRPDAAR